MKNQDLKRAKRLPILKDVIGYDEGAWCVLTVALSGCVFEHGFDVRMDDVSALM